jgi:hypothetical protein
VQRIFSFLLLLFLPLAALADGMVIPTIAYPAKITIPDQRALICFSNGTERLVIETRFTGAGTNFAWVVPLPGQPVIEEATTGLFTTLQYLVPARNYPQCSPVLVRDISNYWADLSIPTVKKYINRFHNFHCFHSVVSRSHPAPRAFRCENSKEWHRFLPSQAVFHSRPQAGRCF